MSDPTTEPESSTLKARKLPDRVCANPACSRTFTPRHNQQHYHSDECKFVVRQARNRENYLATRQLKGPIRKVCENPECGKEFEARDSRSRYCPDCRDKMHRANEAAKRHADPDAFHAYQAGYREKNRERINAAARDRYAQPEINEQERERRSTPEAKAKQAEANKNFRLEHPEKRREYARVRYLRHKDRLNAKSKEWYAALKARLAQAWKPDDWNDPSRADWQPVAAFLLGVGPVSNRELAELLDLSLTIKCQYAATWAEALRLPAGKEFIRRVRAWIRKPGQQGRKSADPDAA